MAAANEEFAKKIERHTIQSLTLSDEQFLTGDAGGKAVTLAGELRIAQGRTSQLSICIVVSSRPSGAGHVRRRFRRMSHGT